MNFCCPWEHAGRDQQLGHQLTAKRPVVFHAKNIKRHGEHRARHLESRERHFGVVVRMGQVQSRGVPFFRTGNRQRGVPTLVKPAVFEADFGSHVDTAGEAVNKLQFTVTVGPVNPADDMIDHALPILAWIVEVDFESIRWYTFLIFNIFNPMLFLIACVSLNFVCDIEVI